MSSPSRFAALAAPLFLLTYGIFRYVDGRDGEHGPGVAWNVGHTFMLAALLCFAAVIVGLRRAVREPSVRRASATTTMTVLGLVGAAAFVRVALGDLFPGADGFLPLPGPLHDAGPLLLLLGLVGLMIDVAIHEPHRLPAWSPMAVVAGFAAVGANLDLLPLAAGLLLAGLMPLAGAPRLERVPVS
ncbi:hypothetical protein [Aeromicrobium sp. Root236]|uniref:hypothetical protein n=1 Tax=Aeromicrobium sp. Root236 TaxID=1736498 RepID=UPI001910F106|nr:hypothetical protein [Aeromicrobium sp. Root236]